MGVQSQDGLAMAPELPSYLEDTPDELHSCGWRSIIIGLAEMTYSTTSILSWPAASSRPCRHVFHQLHRILGDLQLVVINESVTNCSD